MVRLQGNWARSGFGVPNVCAAHGQVAVLRRRTRFASAPPAWTRALFLLGGLGRLLALMVRKKIVVPNWPFCGECESLRTRRLTVALPCLILDIAVILGGVVSPEPTRTRLLVAGIILLVVGHDLNARRRLADLAGGIVSRDGLLLELQDSHPIFDNEYFDFLAWISRPTGNGVPVRTYGSDVTAPSWPTT